MELEAEDVELVLDARDSGPSDDFARLCAEAAMYYVYEPRLASVLRTAGSDREQILASAAHRALRHRTCLIAEEGRRREIADAVASVVRMRVLDLAESPAPIALPSSDVEL